MSLVPLIAFLLGAAVGSFLNVVTLRYPNKPITGRSVCPNCHRQLSWWELIPVLSFLFLKGRCRTCRQKLALQYPLVELFTAFAFFVIFLSPISSWMEFSTRVLSGLVITLLIILFVIDLKTLLLPDLFILILTAVVITKLAIQQSDIVSTAIGITAGSGFILSLWLITSGRGIGFGDVKLMIPLGALFGPVSTLLLLMISFICGGIVALYLLITHRATMKTAIPFGPYIAGTAALFILFPQLSRLILNLLL